MHHAKPSRDQLARDHPRELDLIFHKQDGGHSCLSQSTFTRCRRTSPRIPAARCGLATHLRQQSASTRSAHHVRAAFSRPTPYRPMIVVTTMKVLVVEDGRTTRMMLKSAVERLGHECLTAADGSEAWEIFRAVGPDVIISDWLMPGIEGPELCRLVRANPGPYTYFVLLTAFGDKSHAMEGMQGGADDYLAETLDVDDLRLRLIGAERVSSLHKRLAEQDARLRALAEVDQLTQLANRHKSTETLTQVLNLARS